MCKALVTAPVGQEEWVTVYNKGIKKILCLLIVCCCSRAIGQEREQVQVACQKEEDLLLILFQSLTFLSIKNNEHIYTGGPPH